MKKKRMLLLAAMFVFTFAFIRFNTVDVQAASKYTIYVNRRTNLVNVINSKTGKLVKAMYCSTGRNYRTIRGTYNTTAKYTGFTDSIVQESTEHTCSILYLIIVSIKVRYPQRNIIS